MRSSTRTSLRGESRWWESASRIRRHQHRHRPLSRSCSTSGRGRPRSSFPALHGESARRRSRASRPLCARNSPEGCLAAGRGRPITTLRSGTTWMVPSSVMFTIRQGRSARRAGDEDLVAEGPAGFRLVHRPSMRPDGLRGVAVRSPSCGWANSPHPAKPSARHPIAYIASSSRWRGRTFSARSSGS